MTLPGPGHSLANVSRRATSGPELIPETLHDEIWQAVPTERAIDRAAVELAVEVVRAVDGRVLDLGCGDGRVAAELSRSGARVVGVDPSRVALDRARREHPSLELAEPLADGTLPFEDASFDVVVCLHVLQHVADTQRLLSEARRVLQPGGSMAIAVPWHGRTQSALKALVGFERAHDPLEPVLRFYTARSLWQLLEHLGFEHLRMRGSGGVPLARRTLLARARRP